MKYLKLFESHISYREIDMNQYVSMSKREQIYSTKYTMRALESLKIKYTRDEFDKRIIYTNRMTGNIKLLISEYKDEWFGVALCDDTDIYGIKHPLYYECDQLTGLISLLKDKDIL